MVSDWKKIFLSRAGYLFRGIEIEEGAGLKNKNADYGIPQPTSFIQ